MRAAQYHKKSTGSDLIRGAVAGAIGTAAMDYLVTKPMYRLEDRDAYRQEKAAQVEGKWVAQAAVSKIDQLNGKKNLTERQNFWAGKAVHYMLGVSPGALYAVFRKKVPFIAKGRGLLYGFSLFILNDEITGPAVGIASGPTRYPWQAHVRGLLGHLMTGVATHVALDAMEKLSRASNAPDRVLENSVPSLAEDQAA